MNLKAAAFCALMLAASPAAAEPWDYHGRYAPGAYARPAYAPTVSFHEINASLRADGLRPISRPVFSGRFIVVRAVDHNGDVVRVLLHPRYGDIVSVMRLPPAPIVGEGAYRPDEAYRPQETYPRYGAVGPDLKTEPNDPYAGQNGLERRPAASRTPMPRPRPPVADPTAATAAVTPAPAPAEAPSAAAPSAAAAAPASPVTTGTVAGAASGRSFPPAAPLE